MKSENSITGIDYSSVQTIPTNIYWIQRRLF